LGFRAPGRRLAEQHWEAGSRHGVTGGGARDGPFGDRHVRTYVRMAPRPFRPLRELEGAIERGDLEIAVAISRDIAKERGWPIPLDQALGLVVLAAVQQPDAYDGWALRWLARWLTETPRATIDGAAEVAAALADLPGEPQTSLDTIRQAGQPA
jgi:hypothetical protein